MRTVLLLLALLPALEAQACPSDAVHPIASLNELPTGVLKLLGRFVTPRPDIADIGEKFNLTDAIVGPNNLPWRRLVAGVATGNCIELTIEYGGIGHSTEIVEFQHDDNGWRKTRGFYKDPRPPRSIAP